MTIRKKGNMFMTVEEYLVKRILELEDILEKLGKVNTQLKIENSELCEKLSKYEDIEMNKTIKAVKGE